jgi:23S rRNA pseudouridine955/2504/2580 synthase
MNRIKKRVVNKDEVNLRIDKWFRLHYPSLPHGRLEKLLRDGNIRVDGSRCKANYRLLEGQEIRVPPITNNGRETFKKKNKVTDKNFLNLVLNSIIYKDDRLIVINKPYGVSVQGGTGQINYVDGVLEYLKFGFDTRPKLVHRIDKDTSGILILGRTDKSTIELTELFRKNRIEKIYWAVVIGKPSNSNGIIDVSLKKSVENNYERMEVNSTLGKKSITNFSIVSNLSKKVTWLDLRPITGRTHQLRAHCSYLGVPIIGDKKYGGISSSFTNLNDSKKLHLLARGIKINFDDGKIRIFYAPLPEHMKNTFKYFGFDEVEGKGFE